MKNKRFIPLKNHKGIRKDSITGKYVARKSIHGKQYSETFNTIPEALNWRNQFHPLLTSSELKSTSERDETLVRDKVYGRPNGVDQRFNVGEVWELYRRQHFPSLEPQTVVEREKFCVGFLKGMLQYKMIELNSEFLDAYIAIKVREAQEKSSRRINFNEDLKKLKSFLNWYRENYDSMFVNPVLKRHKIAGIVRKDYVKSNRKMTLKEVKSFFDAFDDPFWRDFAEFHFYMAGRIQEVAGIQKQSIDFDYGLVKISDVSVWGSKKKFTRLKEIPKNGEERVVHFNDKMKEIILRRVRDVSATPCEFTRTSTGERLDFLFHIEGQPLSYRQI